VWPGYLRALAGGERVEEAEQARLASAMFVLRVYQRRTGQQQEIEACVSDLHTIWLQCNYMTNREGPLRIESDPPLSKEAIPRQQEDVTSYCTAEGRWEWSKAASCENCSPAISSPFAQSALARSGSKA
jgi:hypothetical protein